MKLVTILICLQAVFMLASIAATGYIMYNVKNPGAGTTLVTLFTNTSLIFYVALALQGTSLVIHGLSTFWCKK